MDKQAQAARDAFDPEEAVCAGEQQGENEEEDSSARFKQKRVTAYVHDSGDNDIAEHDDREVDARPCENSFYKALYVHL